MRKSLGIREHHDGQHVEDNHGVATREEKLTRLLQYADRSGFIERGSAYDVEEKRCI